MTLGWGIAITNFTSKFGVLSRKASMRLATETGKKMVDKARELGRSLQKTEIEEIFAETLPQKCIPKIITKKEEIYPFMRNCGATDEQIAQQLSQPMMAMACIPNGAAKQPIFTPLGKYPVDFENSYIAHELEHALERNNRIKGIFDRKYEILKQKIRMWLDRTFNTSYAPKFNDKAAKCGSDTQIIQIRLQQENKTLKTFYEDRFNPMDYIMNTDATQEGLAKVIGLDSAKDLLKKVRKSIRENYASGSNANSCGRTRFKILNEVLDQEKPAHIVQGEVEKYAFGLGENQITQSGGTALLYKTAQKAVKQEKWTYYKNKLLGRLKTPDQYTTEKDLFKLFSQKRDKQAVRELVQDMNLEEKIMLFYTIRNNPQSIRNIKQFLDATKDMQNGGYKRYLEAIMNIDPKSLRNPDFMKIARIQTGSRPEYVDALEYLQNRLSEAQITEFAKIADIRGLRGECKYQTLYQCMDSPDFEKLKAFADIEIKGNAEVQGYHPFESIGYTEIRNLPSEKIEEFLNRAQNAAKKGKDISNQLYQEASEIIAKMHA